MKHLVFIIILISTLSCQSQNKQSEAVTKVKYEELLEKVTQEDGVLYVVNFWATWCKPCVEELPDFLAANDKYKDNSNFKMYLISIDMPSTADSMLPAYLAEHNINAEVLLLDDAKRMNTWIPAFDSSWSGAIPATVIYKNGESLFFHEGKVGPEELNNLITQNLE